MEKGVGRVKKHNCSVDNIQGKEGRDVIGVLGDTSCIDPNIIKEIVEVLDVIRISLPFKRFSREYNPKNRVIPDYTPG